MAQKDQAAPVPSRRRIAAIDIARGVALIAMAIYHFAWDLEFFGYSTPGTAATGGWKIFARSIATSFLFLVGVSLFLAHAKGIRWTPFLKRLGKVIVAAALITVVTWYATPQTFIFFGILHQIALASLLGLAFLRLPAAMILVTGAAIIALPFFYRADLFAHSALWWVGLSPVNPRSNDYVPLFPWFGVVLLGIAAAKIATANGWLEKLRALGQPNWLALPDLLGRYSLSFYLLHQPVLIALVWLFAQIFPPAPVPDDIRFVNACRSTCQETRPADFCSIYCVCMLEEMQTNDLLDSMFGSGQTKAEREAVQGLAASCTATTEKALQGGISE